MKKINHLLAACGLSLAITQGSALAGNIDITKLPPPADKQGVTFEKDISPLLKDSCVNCHSGQRPKAGLTLESLTGVLKGSKEGKVVVPGKSAESAMVIAISQLDPEKAMPPKPRQRRGGAGGPGGGPDQGGPGGPGGGPGGPGRAPAKPLTAEQVGLVRAWIDQGAK